MVYSSVFDAPAADDQVEYTDLNPASSECDLFDAAISDLMGNMLKLL